MEKKSIREVKGEYRHAEWVGLVRECRHSGLNVMTWCEWEGITTNQFYKWQRKVFDVYRSRNLHRGPAAPPGLALLWTQANAEV